MTTPAPESASWTSRFSRPFSRRDSLVTAQRLDEDTPEDSSESAEATYSDQHRRIVTGARSAGALGEARGPRGDWDRLPPTDQQVRYIRVLGGDPTDARTKAEASDLIDRLRRLKGASPLDPYSLEKRGARAGVEAGSDWMSAHDSLLSGLRLDLQQYIDTTLDSLQAKLSDSCGPGGVRQTFGPQNLVREGKLHLERLRVWRHHGKRTGVPIPDISPLLTKSTAERVNGGGQLRGGSPNGDLVTSREDSRDDQQPPSWWGLIAIAAIFLVIEALVNAPLLMSALPGGAVEGVTIAILVSLINVGGLGVGGGLLFSWLRRQPGSSNLIRRAFFPVWLFTAMGFNLVAGRHRAAYSRVVEAVERNTIDRPTPQELLPDIAFNPLTWEFQALLFALLGLILCAMGFAKGFFFIKSEGKARSVATEIPEQDNVPEDGLPREVVAAYEDVLNQFKTGIGQLRSDVADWHASLDQKRREMHDTVNMLVEEKNRQACIECVTHAFIAEYNNGHAEKIDLAVVEAHRTQKYPDPILVTPSDTGVLQEAAELAAEWRKSGQASLEQRITDAQERMIALWAQYEPLVLGPGQSGKAITYGLGTNSKGADLADHADRFGNDEPTARES